MIFRRSAKNKSPKVAKEARTNLYEKALWSGFCNFRIFKNGEFIPCRLPYSEEKLVATLLSVIEIFSKLRVPNSRINSAKKGSTKSIVAYK